jgi:hypothetical protein
MSRVAIYVRVSTIGQTTENQLRELRAVAKREGHKVVAEFTDNGISGAKNREARPGLNSLLEGVTRREFDKVRTPRDPAMQACTAAAGNGQQGVTSWQHALDLIGVRRTPSRSAAGFETPAGDRGAGGVDGPPAHRNRATVPCCGPWSVRSGAPRWRWGRLTAS